ncbi:hypothetical protein BGX28_005092 [Mortierella sp. GBA30]|nr:hypothetical protein BGX28_005092 [Mortierella sp. GBA30]
MPPAPNMAQNRGSASPHHAKADLAPAPSPSGPVAESTSSVGKESPRTRSGKAYTPTTTVPSAAPTASAPPTLANTADVVFAAVPSIQRQNRWLRRLIARMLLLYLSYTFFFVCPNVPETGNSNILCDGVIKAQNWLRPYSESAVEKLDQTYRTYAEPYVDQYGRPLYKQGHKYYVDVAHPAIMTASVKAKDCYHQYAHPHVSKACEKLYTDDMKARVNRAQTSFVAYQKQAQQRVDHVKKKSKEARDHARHLHSIHVQPVIDKVSPHARFAWDKVSLGAQRTFDAAGVHYMKHVNPYAEQSLALVWEAAVNAKDAFYRHTDEIFGKKFNKKDHPVTRPSSSRTAHRAAEKAEKVKKVKEQTKANIKDAKHEADSHAETLKDTLLKKAANVQKLAEEYAEDAKEAIHEKVAGAQKVAEEYTESIKSAVRGQTDEAKKKAAASQQHLKKKAPNVEETIKAAAANKGQGGAQKAEEYIEHLGENIARKAHDAQKIVGEEAEHLKKMADEKVEEAGKVSEQIKKTVVEKAREAQEAVARKAENIKEKIVGAGHDAKESMDKEAEHIIKVVREQEEKLLQKEKEARKMAEAAAHRAQKAFDAVGEEAESVRAKVAQMGEDAGKSAQDFVGNVKHSAQERIKHAQETVQEQTERIQHASDQIVMGGKEHIQQVKDASDKLKDQVGQQAKHAGDQAAQAKEKAKHKMHDAHTASKASLAAMLAGIETTFGKFYEYEDTETKNLWDKLQAAIDEHLAGAKKSAQDLEQANREAYEAFESYVRDWRSRGGDLGERLTKLRQRSVDSIKHIGQKAEEGQDVAKSKAQILEHNVEVYLSGLKDFLMDRLAASKETVTAELNVFKDTSSEDDEKTVRTKLTELESAAKAKLEETSMEAHNKAQTLLKQVEDLWAQSENKSRQYVERTRQLAQKAGDDVMAAARESKEKIQAAKDEAQNRVQEAADKLGEMLTEKRQQQQQQPTDAEAEPNIRIAMEEPGSGHRHHRH